VVLRPCYWKCITGVKNWGRTGRILTPNELDLTFGVPDYAAKFHQNRVRIATVGGWTDRQTRQMRVNLLSVPCYAIAMGQIKTPHFGCRKISKVYHLNCCVYIWHPCMFQTTSITQIPQAHLPAQNTLLISAPSLRVYYFLSLSWSVCLSVCHKHCFFFFVSRWNRAISWPSVLHELQNIVFRFLI